MPQQVSLLQAKTTATRSGRIAVGAKLRTYWLGHMFEYEGSRHEFLKFLAEFGEEPSFLARARAVETALDLLLRECAAKYEDLLRGPRLRLAMLTAQVANDWSRLIPLLADSESMALLQELPQRWATTKPRQAEWFVSDGEALRRFVQSAERFNRGWRTFLDRLDLEPVNHPRREYNQFYVLEKECAFGNEKVAENFEPLAMIDRPFLEERFPRLVVPRLK
jgi:hypothetical protein